jgi:hypothetical protein
MVLLRVEVGNDMSGWRIIQILSVDYYQFVIIGVGRTYWQTNELTDCLTTSTDLPSAIKYYSFEQAASYYGTRSFIA